MIFYFSGLGNTAFAAKKIGNGLKEKFCFIPDILPEKVEINDETNIGFMFPIYSWGVPPIVTDFILHLSESTVNKIKEMGVSIWTVCTYGDESGNAIEMLSDCLKRRGLKLRGAWGVEMPNTYVLLPGFDVDSPELEKKKLENAASRIVEITEKIKNGNWEWNFHTGSFPKLRTGLIFPLFKKYGINPKKWHYTSACVKCGRCVKSCPVKNISLNHNGPEWGSDCISCLACYHNCPYHAVEYARITRNKGQYVCPYK